MILTIRMILYSKNLFYIVPIFFLIKIFFNCRNIDHRTNVNFDLAEGDLGQHELFDKICAENINTLDDTDDQIFEERDHTFETVIEKHTERRGGVCSSDSDEEDLPSTGEEPIMDVDRKYIIFLFSNFLSIVNIFLHAGVGFFYSILNLFSNLIYYGNLYPPHPPHIFKKCILCTIFALKMM